MIILPQSVEDACQRLWEDFRAGNTTEEAMYRKLLELEPNDFVGLVGMAKSRRDAGDTEGAEDLYWRAIQTNPCAAEPLLDLARMLRRDPESTPLAMALGELGLAKRLREQDDFLDNLDFEKFNLDASVLEELRKLPPTARRHLIVLSMREDRASEPEAVTERLRPLRLIEELQYRGELDPETVDSIIAEGEAIVPLLIGVVRAWARNFLNEDDDVDVERALALLAETGSPAEIPPLLELADLENDIARGAASWALGRIWERHPKESVRLIESVVAGLGPAERLKVAELIVRHPEFDPKGKLLERLSENVESMPKSDRDRFFPLLVGAMAIARGREGVSMARAELRRRRELLSRSARRECEDLLSIFEQDGAPPKPPERPVTTVYEICAGQAVWDEDDDEEEEEEEDEDTEDEFLPAPEPIRRKAAPGRNDPCWCNSGKKYKKCHLDSDERESRGTGREEEPSARGANEFTGLRKNIGEFLGQAVTQKEMRRALAEFLGDAPGEDGDTDPVLVTDWMIHDWIAPALGHTVMQEFLVRHGSRLSAREREMVEAWSKSFVGFYEVQQPKPGIGVELRDLIFGETFFVHDVNMSSRLVKWDALMARVVPGERGTEFSGVGEIVPRGYIKELQEWMEADRGERGVPWRAYLKENWPRIRRQSFEIAEDRMDALQLANTDGEELLFSKAVYKTVDEEAAIGALRHCREIEDNSDNDRSAAFVWLNKTKTVLGNIRIGNRELIIEANSRQRLERGKDLIFRLAGESVRHVRDEFTTQKEMRRRMKEEPRTSPGGHDELPEDVRDEALVKILDQHYANWPDTNLPGLGGKTPRQAAKTAKGREEVNDILKFIENGEERKRQRGEPFYDVARLRAQLGLE